MVPLPRGQIAEHRGLSADRLNVFQGEVDFGFAGEGEDEGCHWLIPPWQRALRWRFQGVSGEDVARADVSLEEESQGGADPSAFVTFLFGDGGSRGGIR